MSIYALISPAPTWQAPRPVPAKPPVRQINASPEDWQDHAAAQNWASAVVAFLRTKPRQTAAYWETINSIVSESGQPSRLQVRLATLELLAVLKTLRHQRHILRFRRRTLALLESGPVVPMEEIPKRAAACLVS